MNKSSKNISAQIIDDVNNKLHYLRHLRWKKIIKKINKAKKSDLSLFVAETLAKKANEKKYH